MRPTVRGVDDPLTHHLRKVGPYPLPTPTPPLIEPGGAGGYLTPNLEDGAIALYRTLLTHINIHATLFMQGGRLRGYYSRGRGFAPVPYYTPPPPPPPTPPPPPNKPGNGGGGVGPF